MHKRLIDSLGGAKTTFPDSILFAANLDNQIVDDMKTITQFS
jgi:hypothetical protein